MNPKVFVVICVSIIIAVGAALYYGVNAAEHRPAPMTPPKVEMPATWTIETVPCSDGWTAEMLVRTDTHGVAVCLRRWLRNDTAKPKQETKVDADKAPIPDEPAPAGK